jgi:hypothetical protein
LVLGIGETSRRLNRPISSVPPVPECGDWIVNPVRSTSPAVVRRASVYLQ